MDSSRIPVVPYQAHTALTANNRDRVPLFVAAVVPVRIEVVEATLRVGKDAMAVF